MTTTPPAWLISATPDVDEIRRPGSLTLVLGERTQAVSLLGALGSVLGAPPISATEAALADGSAVTSEAELADRLAPYPCLYDLETVLWEPWLHLDPVRLLRQLAQRQGVIALWPGSLSGRTLSFSSPGRRDFVSVPISGVSILRPVATQFPDEVPFTLERIPA